jgi:Fe-S cluster biosynthesis and repair protein YggX
MSEHIVCTRCQREAMRLDSPPLPGPTGAELQEKICTDCWAEWQGMEVMVINELRLNFMDPAAQQVLDLQMREFLALEAPDREPT